MQSHILWVVEDLWVATELRDEVLRCYFSHKVIVYTWLTFKCELERFFMLFSIGYGVMR